MANWVSLVYCVITTVFFFFPGGPDPAPGDMNYAIAVFGIMLVIALLSWLAIGRVMYLKTEAAVASAREARKQEVETCDGAEADQAKPIATELEVGKGNKTL